MRNKGWIKLLTATIFVAVLSGCADPDDEEEGGIVGTGLILEGTVTELRELASNTLQVKSATGEITNAMIDDTGRYRALSVKGDAPYLMRVDLGNDDYRYGIAFDDVRANIHSYTDTVLRNWFEFNNTSVDVQFDQDAFTTVLPSRTEFRTNANAFFDLTRLVLDSYNVTGEQLLTGDYDSGTLSDGIDQFLRSNPVLVQDERISFVITDPITQTQSMTRSDFAVFELAGDADTQSPDTPESVRAIASATNEIVLIWEPASDNRGVVAYEIFRDGVFVDTTPYPVYVDTDPVLAPNQEYSYQVVAVDAGNNTSAPSIEATSMTLAELDNTAPPAPVQLSVTPTLGSMELIWGQTQIGDVVGFDVYRGRDGNTPVFLNSVTSTIMTDLTVASGVVYCYQIVAVDASGNESDRSSEVCRTAEGQEVDSDMRELSSLVPPLAGLTIPDTQNMECVEEWVSTTVNEPLAIAAGCYLVDEDIEIGNGGALSLAPGVVMQFGAGVAVNIRLGGSLSAVGTKEQPVMFSGQDPTPGFWDGLHFLESNSLRNELVNTVVEHAGNGSREAAISLVTNSSSQASLAISDSVIRQCLHTGLRAEKENSTVRTLDGSVITECENPLHLHWSKYEDVSQRNNFTGNRNDLAEVGDALFVVTTQLKDLGIPYIADDIVVSSAANLGLLAGVEIQFRTNGALVINGSLRTFGEIDRRVRITGQLEEPGSWEGLSILGDASFQSTDVVFAGGLRSNSELDGAISVRRDYEVEFSDVRVMNSASYGITIEKRLSNNQVLNGVELRGNARNIRIPFASVDRIGADMTFQNNTENSIVLFSLTSGFSGNVDIRNFGVPFLLTSTPTWQSGVIRIYPGVEMIFQDGVSIEVANLAQLLMLGTAEEPIILTGETTMSGSWGGISIRTSSSSSRLEHTHMRYAGSFGEAKSASITLDCEFGGNLSVSESIIEDSAGWGIFSTGTENCSPSIGDNVVFRGNRLGDIGFDF